MRELGVHLPHPARSPASPRRTPRAAVRPSRESERPATIEDWLRVPEEKRAELIAGRIVQHAFPGVKHGDTQAQISHFLRPYRQRRSGGGGGGGGSPGGWWLSQEVDLFIADVGCRPDIVGWRRDKHARVPQPNAQGVITEVPDFVCEVLSPSTARFDTVEKQKAYFRAGVPHYWLVDPERSVLTVQERTDRGYLVVLTGAPGHTVRAAPFEGVEIPIDELFLDEEGELPEEASTSSPPTTSPTPTLPTSAGEPASPHPGAKPRPRGPAPKKRAPRTRG